MPAGSPLTPQYVRSLVGAPVAASSMPTVRVGCVGRLGVTDRADVTTGVMDTSMTRVTVVRTVVDGRVDAALTRPTSRVIRVASLVIVVSSSSQGSLEVCDLVSVLVELSASLDRVRESLTVFKVAAVVFTTALVLGVGSRAAVKLAASREDATWGLRVWVLERVVEAVEVEFVNRKLAEALVLEIVELRPWPSSELAVGVM